MLTLLTLLPWVADFFVTKPRAVVLSFWIGADGCGWPISSSRYLAGIARRVLTNYAPISASAAEIMTFRMIFAIVLTAPLFVGNSTSSDTEKSVLLRGSLPWVR